MSQSPVLPMESREVDGFVFRKVWKCPQCHHYSPWEKGDEHVKMKIHTRCEKEMEVNYEGITYVKRIFK